MKALSLTGRRVYTLYNKRHIGGRNIGRGGAFLLCAAMLLAPYPADARKKQKSAPLPPADTGLIDNVNGLAVAADGRLVHFTGLLIGKDGRVEQRLMANDKRPERLAYRLDAQGKTLIPSFVDSHAQVMAAGIARLTLDLSDTSSLEQALTKITAYVRNNPGRKWILGRGWNTARWAAHTPGDSSERWPTAADLDAIASDIPIWLESADGEMGWANSLAMKQAGISEATKAPAGGRIITANGRPSGLFSGAAMDLVTHIIPPPAPKDRDLALDKAQPLFLSAGIGTVADMTTSIDDWQSYRRAGDRGALRLRIVGYADSIANMALIAGPAPTPWLYTDHLRLAGVHFAIDGSLSTRTAWLKAPYADAPEQQGQSKIDSTRLRNQMSRAAMDGFQIALSAHGDAAVEESIYAIDELAATYKGDRRWRIDGADIWPAALMNDMGAHDTLVTVRPGLFASEGAAMARRIGPDRAFLSLSALGKDGNSLSIGEWTTGATPTPFVSIAAAMSRADAQGNPFGGQPPATERLNFEQAFAAATRNGAYALGAEKQVGSLEPGQWADFLLIDRDISMASPADIAKTKLLEHWQAGHQIWSAGKGVDTSSASPPPTSEPQPQLQPQGR